MCAKNAGKDFISDEKMMEEVPAFNLTVEYDSPEELFKLQKSWRDSYGSIFGNDSNYRSMLLYYLSLETKAGE